MKSCELSRPVLPQNLFQGHLPSAKKKPATCLAVALLWVISGLQTLPEVWTLELPILQGQRADPNTPSADPKRLETRHGKCTVATGLLVPGKESRMNKSHLKAVQSWINVEPKRLTNEHLSKVMSQAACIYNRNGLGRVVEIKACVLDI